MKCVGNLLSFGLAATLASAAPVVERQIDLFQLQVSSPMNKDLDGRFLALDNSTLGLFDDDIDPLTVYPVDSEKEGCNELHTYPVGFVDHSLALVGPPGLLTLVDMMNPDSVSPDDGNVALFDTFRIVDGKVTNDSDGQWLAFPDTNNEWKVKWSDGTAVTTENFMPVDVMYISAGEGRYNGK
ncbi:hypothetical protein F4779DRAFT_591338 [Xylariaceae sp. FL0662B]|nr:hypothetical protein F4779DRAFT_591338 [Xylariaceae sp. FL0662B]